MSRPAPDSTSTTSVSDPLVEADRTLVSALMTGDRAAWRRFSQNYKRMLYACIGRVVRRYPGLIGDEDVDEIYALFCLNLLANDMHRLRCYDPGRTMRLGSWLGMLAVHTAYDYLRLMRRQPSGPSVDDLPQLRCSGPDPAEQFEQRCRVRRLAGLLDELSEKDRQFMLLYFGHGLSPQQVAAEMGISVKTVYTKKHKIRGRLESMLGSYCAAA